MSNAKGHFVADEGANRKYVSLGQTEGWTPIKMPPSSKSQRISDSRVVEKFTKRIHPIFTGDEDVVQDIKAGKITKSLLGRSGYIIHKNIKKSGEAHLYESQIKKFFRSHTEKHTHGNIWIIEKTGEPKKIKIF